MEVLECVMKLLDKEIIRNILQLLKYDGWFLLAVPDTKWNIKKGNLFPIQMFCICFSHMIKRLSLCKCDSWFTRSDRSTA